jgi:hypothetical protein
MEVHNNMQYGRTSKRNIHRDAEWEARANERASGLQRYLENMSGQTVRVNIMNWFEGRGGAGEWRVTIYPDNLETEDIMRLAARMLFTMTAGLIDSVTKRMSDRRVKEIARAIEVARTEWLGDVWFKSNLVDATRSELLAEEVAY